MRQPLVVAALGAVLAFSMPARAQSAEVKKYLNAAVTLYENLEYEKALKQIQRAKTKSTGASDDARIALYEGIVFADMGKEDKALNAFKTGLSMEPEAKLPLEVSPKVEKVFNKALENVQRLLGPQLDKQREEERLRVEAEKQRAAEEQRKKDEEAARLAAVKPPEPDRPPPAVVAPAPSGPGMRALAIIPLAIGVASGGAAAYFLFTARGQEASLNNGTAPLGQAISVREQGKTNALLGYAFTGVAAAGIATAGLMFGLGGQKAPAPVTIFAAPGQLYVGVSGALP
ncbi:MAG: repeat domain protein [Myxococcaceae bacterium]|nr:repeat domain protein [Myxococcaceae bacterium]